MALRCVWEHNGEDTLLWCTDLPGVYARGRSLREAEKKLPTDALAFLRWSGLGSPGELTPAVVQEKVSALNICDADSDVLFDTERAPLTPEEYGALKALALRSASDFLALYEAVPDRQESALPARESFYGSVPRTAEEMYLHTKNVNSYYFREIGVAADNEGTILSCRAAGFRLLEEQTDFLCKPVILGSYAEEWSLRKVLRRFLWHDRIHAKAMVRMAEKTFGPGCVPDVFCFQGPKDQP